MERQNSAFLPSLIDAFRHAGVQLTLRLELFIIQAEFYTLTSQERTEKQTDTQNLKSP